MMRCATAQFLRVCFFCIAVTFFAVFACAQDSVIGRMQDLAPTIVEVSVEAAAAAKSPQGVFLDKDSGQLIVMEKVQAFTAQRGGVGVVIDPSGLIVTCAHTIHLGGKITIIFFDGRSKAAQIVWVAPEDDIAFLRVDGYHSVPWVEFADSVTIKPGIPVYALKKNNESLMVAQGVITAVGKKESVSGGEDIEVMQTTIGIRQGDSGTPLFDSGGCLLGMLTSAHSDDPAQSVGLTSPAIERNYRRYILLEKIPSAE